MADQGDGWRKVAMSRQGDGWRKGSYGEAGRMMEEVAMAEVGDRG